MGILAGGFLLFWLLFRIAPAVDLARIRGEYPTPLLVSDALSLLAIVGVATFAILKKIPPLIASYLVGVLAFGIAYVYSGSDLALSEEVRSFAGYGIALLILNFGLFEAGAIQRQVDQNRKG